MDTTTVTTATSTTASAQAKVEANENYMNFLTLLTAQLENQDPMEPMDNSQFVTQIAQLSQVEQAVATNENLEDIAGLLEFNSSISETALIGKMVEVEATTFALEDGVSDYSIEVAEDAAEVTATISTASGTVVRSIDLGAINAGEKTSLNWDGKDDSGQSVGDGVYTVNIVATTDENATVDTSGFVRAAVKSIVFEDGAGKIQLTNNQSVTKDEIIQVS